MVVQVQQPLNASNMSLPASFGTGVAGQDGLLYYTGSIGDLPAGQSLEIPVAYQKPDDTLSVSNLEVSPSKPIQEKPPLPVWLVPTLLLLVGFGLIGGGVWWYWSSGRSRSRQSEPARVRINRLVRRNLPGRMGRCIASSAASAPRLAIASAGRVAHNCEFQMVGNPLQQKNWRS